MDELDVKLEAVFFETTVDAVVEMAEAAFQAGASRELILVEMTAMLLENMGTPPQLASMASMTMMMLAEKRSETDDRLQTP